MKITKKVTFIAKQEHISTVKKLLEDMVAPSLKEPGCLFYYIFQSQSNPKKFFAVESWVNNDALEGHKHTEHYAYYKSNYEPFVDDKYTEDLELLDKKAYTF
ncbi:MAG: putative quinol monooxygenase [Sulfuricurvum sp.]|nr:putative quinol monooxygenase [Sulfuricurvum sp.]